MASVRPPLLTTRQRKFLSAYLECGNAAEAGRRAGYSESTCRINARRILETPSLQLALEKERERMAELQRSTLSDEQLINTDFASRENVLANIEKVRQSAVEKGDLSAQLRALELLGKASALFVDRKISEGSELTILLQQASEAQKRLREKIVN